MQLHFRCPCLLAQILCTGLPLAPEVNLLGSSSSSSSKMAASEGGTELPRLAELFETSKQLVEEVDQATEPSGTRVIQEKVYKGLDLLEKAAEMISQLDLFSRNEDLEEIASINLKYLMVPAFQAALTMKQVNPSKRLDHLQQAREHFINFLTQCHYYHVAEFQLPHTRNNSAENNTASSSVASANIVSMASQRQAKIERYRQKKEADSRLSALKSAVEGGQADDEQVREYYLLHLRRWIGISLEEIDSIDQEIKIVRDRGSAGEASASHSSLQERPLFRPFILTRDKAQAKVFGTGYPALPTMTVNDWYEQRQKYGGLPPLGINKPTSGMGQEVSEISLEQLGMKKGKKLPKIINVLSRDLNRRFDVFVADFRRMPQQQEDEESEKGEGENSLRRAQEWDDWKDSHPRGYGNRQNMG